MEKRAQRRTGSSLQCGRKRNGKEKAERLPAEKAEVGHVLKTLPVIDRNGEIRQEKVEIRNTLKDMRLMSVEALQWTGEKGRFVADTGRGLTIQGCREETGTAWLRAGERKSILVDLDPIAPSGEDETICRICFRGVHGGIHCPMKEGTVCYQHCFECKYGQWSGDHQSCRYRHKKGPALW